MLLWKTRVSEDEEVDLFTVENTARKVVFVLAKDVATARAIAATSGHLKNDANGTCQRCGFTKPHPWLPINVSAVRRAANERVQGVVKPSGNFVTIRDEVFAPLSGVD